jgi:hypothetical protein
MKTIMIGVLVLLLLAGGLLLGGYRYLRWKLQRMITMKYAVLGPLIKKLAAREPVERTEILFMAKDPSLRHAVYRVLEAFNQLHLFPLELFTVEKGAESFLVTWLEFPTELGQAPHEIELYATIVLNEGDDQTYYVFKYRMTGDHWATENNWMLGVTGPYRSESQPYDIPRRIFSRFYSVDRISARGEVQWVHENIEDQ